METRKIPLSKILQGRYKAILGDRDRYLFSLLKYIHYNPVRAQIAEVPGKYRWSSYRAYLTRADNRSLIDMDPVLRLFSGNKGRARRHYEAFMKDGATVKKEDVYATIDQRLLGDEKFIEEVAGKCDGDVRKGWRKKECPLPQIAAAAEKRYHVTLDKMRSWTRTAEVVMGRRVFSLMAKEYGYTGREIAEFLKKDPAAVTAYLRQGEGLRREVEKVLKRLGKSVITQSLSLTPNTWANDLWKFSATIPVKVTAPSMDWILISSP